MFWKFKNYLIRFFILDGDVWFYEKDLQKVLDYEGDHKIMLETKGNTLDGVYVVSEWDAYPFAEECGNKAFCRWMTHDVLPFVSQLSKEVDIFGK